MTNPVIISVFNQKLHTVARTVVDYGRQDAIIDKIRDFCQKNDLTVKVEVAGTEEFFLSKLFDKSTHV